MRIVLSLVDPAASATPVEVAVTAAPGTPFGTVRRPLLAAVAPRDGRLFIGSVELADDAPLGVPPLLAGAVLTVDRPVRRDPGGLLQLHVVAGPDSGAVHRLGTGEHVVGRAVGASVRVADPDVSRLHAVLRVAVDRAGDTTVRDLSSTNGTAVDGAPVTPDGCALPPGAVLQVGSTRLTLVEPDVVPVSCRPDGAGHLEVNRPPRHVAVPTPLRVARPTPPPGRERRRLPLVALLLPLLGGLALVAVTRSPTYLLFVLLSPLMVLGTFVSDWAGGARSARALRAAYDEACTLLDAAVAQAVADEAAARHRTHPGPAELMLTASGPRPRLWERRCADADALELRLGLGTLCSQVEVRGPPAPTGAHLRENVEHPPMTAVPVTVSLATAGVLGLAGPRARVLPLARALVAQLAGWHSPRQVRLALLAPGSASDWDWVRWLPHLQPVDGAAGPLLVATHDGQLRSRVDELVALLEARQALSTTRLPGDRVVARTVVVLDGAGMLRREPGVARLLAEGPAVGLHLLCLEQDLVSLPVECGSTVEVTGPAGTRLRVAGPGPAAYDDVVADGVSGRWAHRFARALAPLRDATPDDQDAGLPAAARLLDLLPSDVTDPAVLAAAWARTPRDTRTVLGVGPGGEPFVVDLATDGPHALVAGTTGAGKSELLQTLVAGLAAGNRPDELVFVLVDYKGGAAFGDCARLPHTVGLVTDLDSHLTERALVSLGAELRRRERLLAAAGCTDLAGYQQRAPAGRPPIPRMVIVVDEFATLVDELPDFVGGLVGIAQRGRSLGVHLVLATQRPAGVVSADIRANTGLRIALRVTDPGESLDVVDVKDAAAISRAHPGRAVLRVGAGAVRALQTARVSGRPPGAPRARVTPAPWHRAGETPDCAEPAQLTTGPTDLARLVEAARAAASRLAVPPVASPWLAPLPDVVTLADLADVEVGPHEVPIGLLDLPAEQRRAALTFDLDGVDHLLVAGSARSGRTSVLRTLAAGLAAGCEVSDLHLFVLDGGGGLGPLAALPHCGAVVGRDETSRGARLLARLLAELDRRQRLLGVSGFGSHGEQRRAVAPADRLPWLVLLADGWDGLATAYETMDHGRPAEALLRLTREGAGVGIRVVLTGDRGLLASRVGAGFGQRLVLRLADPADYGLAGIAPRAVPAVLPPGRALTGSAAQVAQLAVLDPDTSGAGQLRALDRVAVATRARPPTAHAHPGLAPIRVEPLPARVCAADVAAAAKAVATGPDWVLVGIGGDELAPLGVDLNLDGPSFVIAGPPGSGRSATLAVMAHWLLGQGRELAVVAHRRSPLTALAGDPGVLDVLGPHDAPALDRLLSGRPGLVVLADDAETLHDTPVEQPLLGLLRPDSPGGGLLLAGCTSELASAFRGLTVAARRGRTGLLLGPLGPADGDLLGVRSTGTEAATGAGPGRGLLVVRGRATPVQVAHHRP